MDIAQIHAGSFATRIAQVAAAELAAWLQSDDDFPIPVETWFDLQRSMPVDDGAAADEIVDRQKILDELGDYVCNRNIEHGETLYRYAVGAQLVEPIGEWAGLPFERRQPWETFVSTCRMVHTDLAAAQLAIVEARRQAAAEQPAAGINLEDSIFEEAPSLGEMMPHAVEALRQSDVYQRTLDEQLQAERQRLVGLIAMRAKFNGADPAKFDHDGDGKPGGAKPAGSGPGQPLSVGEPPARPPVNRGGRGNKKAP